MVFPIEKKGFYLAEIVLENQRNSIIKLGSVKNKPLNAWHF